MRLYYRIKSAIRDAYWDFRRRCQRFKRGYAYGDVWDMDFWFITTVKPMLIHLRDHGIGVPNELYVDEDGNERAKWEEVLTEMIHCLDMMDEYSVRRGLDLWYGKSLTTADYQRISNTMEGNKNRFFELFNKYFYNLWD